jgi:hypothetical protein
LLCLRERLNMGARQLANEMVVINCCGHERALLPVTQHYSPTSNPDLDKSSGRGFESANGVTRSFFIGLQIVTTSQVVL